MEFLFCCLFPSNRGKQGSDCVVLGWGCEAEGRGVLQTLCGLQWFSRGAVFGHLASHKRKNHLDSWLCSSSMFSSTLMDVCCTDTGSHIILLVLSLADCVCKRRDVCDVSWRTEAVLFCFFKITGSSSVCGSPWHTSRADKTISADTFFSC